MIALDRKDVWEEASGASADAPGKDIWEGASAGVGLKTVSGLKLLQKDVKR